MEYQGIRVESSNVIFIVEFNRRWDMICSQLSEIDDALYSTPKNNPAIRLFVLTGGKVQFGAQG